MIRKSVKQMMGKCGGTDDTVLPPTGGVSGGDDWQGKGLVNYLQITTGKRHDYAGWLAVLSYSHVRDGVLLLLAGIISCYQGHGRN